MIKIHKGECHFQFKVEGYMKDAPQKTKQKWYKTQIRLALSNANIQARNIDVFFD